MRAILVEFEREFHRHKELADRALASLDEAAFAQQLSASSNSVALIVKHLAGNLRSRWMDFLTTDGDKPDRNRDGEFVLATEDTRDFLLGRWEAGWRTLFGSLASLQDADLSRVVTIRGEPHTVLQATIRSVTHAAYHVGQILYVARCLNPKSDWLTIAPGQSRSHRAGYLK